MSDQAEKLGSDPDLDAAEADPPRGKPEIRVKTPLPPETLDIAALAKEVPTYAEKINLEKLTSHEAAFLTSVAQRLPERTDLATPEAQRVLVYAYRAGMIPSLMYSTQYLAQEGFIPNEMSVGPLVAQVDINKYRRISEKLPDRHHDTFLAHVYTAICDHAYAHGCYVVADKAFAGDSLTFFGSDLTAFIHFVTTLNGVLADLAQSSEMIPVMAILERNAQVENLTASVGISIADKENMSDPEWSRGKQFALPEQQRVTVFDIEKPVRGQTVAGPGDIGCSAAVLKRLQAAFPDAQITGLTYASKDPRVMQLQISTEALPPVETTFASPHEWVGANLLDIFDKMSPAAAAAHLVASLDTESRKLLAASQPSVEKRVESVSFILIPELMQLLNDDRLPRIFEHLGALLEEREGVSFYMCDENRLLLTGGSDLLSLTVALQRYITNELELNCIAGYDTGELNTGPLATELHAQQRYVRGKTVSAAARVTTIRRHDTAQNGVFITKTAADNPLVSAYLRTMDAGQALGKPGEAPFRVLEVVSFDAHGSYGSTDTPALIREHTPLVDALREHRLVLLAGSEGMGKTSALQSLTTRDESRPLTIIAPPPILPNGRLPNTVSVDEYERAILEVHLLGAVQGQYEGDEAAFSFDALPDKLRDLAPTKVIIRIDGLEDFGPANHEFLSTFLETLLSSPDYAHVYCVGTYNPDSPRAAPFRGSSAMNKFHAVPMTPTSVKSMRAILEAHAPVKLDSNVLQRLVEVSDGNPKRALELLHIFTHISREDLDDLGAFYTQALDTYLAEVGKDSQEVNLLHAASVFLHGEGFLFTEIRHQFDENITDESIAGWLASLVAKDVLTLLGDRYYFTARWVHEATRKTLTEADREILYVRAADIDGIDDMTRAERLALSLDCQDPQKFGSTLNSLMGITEDLFAANADDHGIAQTGKLLFQRVGQHSERLPGPNTENGRKLIELLQKYRNALVKVDLAHDAYAVDLLLYEFVSNHPSTTLDQGYELIQNLFSTWRHRLNVERADNRLPFYQAFEDIFTGFESNVGMSGSPQLKESVSTLRVLWDVVSMRLGHKGIDPSHPCFNEVKLGNLTLKPSAICALVRSLTAIDATNLYEFDRAVRRATDLVSYTDQHLEDVPGMEAIYHVSYNYLWALSEHPDRPYELSDVLGRVDQMSTDAIQRNLPQRRLFELELMRSRLEENTVEATNAEVKQYAVPESLPLGFIKRLFNDKLLESGDLADGINLREDIDDEDSEALRAAENSVTVESVQSWRIKQHLVDISRLWAASAILQEDSNDDDALTARQAEIRRVLVTEKKAMAANIIAQRPHEKDETRLQAQRYLAEALIVEGEDSAALLILSDIKAQRTERDPSGPGREYRRAVALEHLVSHKSG